MTDREDHQSTKKSSGTNNLVDAAQPFAGRASVLDSLYHQSHAAKWELSRERFSFTLERSAKKRLAIGPLSPEKLEEFLGALHLEDLALACACAEGHESAWEYFVQVYRGYLRSAAGAILRGSATSAEACELADSLFAELYGLADGKRGERSLFRYFHGRSSLKTWLRAVLAQRHIDKIRAGRRFEELGEDEPEDGERRAPTGPLHQPADPHRARYELLFQRALQAALEQLEAGDVQRLRLYYAEGKKLAEIGRLLGEHESSVSRSLDRIRRELRQKVEEILRLGAEPHLGGAAGRGLDDAEISLCFEYAAQDAAIDLDKLFKRTNSPRPLPGRQER